MVKPTRPTPTVARKASVLVRTTPLSIQLLVRTDNSTNIIIGFDNQEQYQLGPYPSTVSISEALTLVAADFRLLDTCGVRKLIDDSVNVARVTERMGL